MWSIRRATETQKSANGEVSWQKLKCEVAKPQNSPLAGNATSEKVEAG
jgi:hypothetical protein